MQFLAGSGYYDKGIGATYDPDDKNQESELMEAIANYTMDQYSKGSGNQITDVKTKIAKTGGNSRKKEEKEEETKKFDFYDQLENANIAVNGEIDKEATLEEIKKILIDADPGVVIRASDSALDDELDRSLPEYNENDLYIKVTPSGSKKQAPYKRLSLDALDKYIGIGAGSTEFGPFIDEEKINDFMITTLQSYQGPSSGAAKFNP
jgi:hypothetical protein